MGNLFLNYLLEFAMLFPGAALALMPMRGHFRYRAGIVYFAAFDCIAVFGVIGALAASSLGIPTNYILTPGCLLLLIPLYLVSTLHPAKTAFCFSLSALLCSFTTMYAVYLTAPWELGNANPVFTVQSALACLGLAIVICLLFARTCLVKLPALFDNKSLDKLWKWITLGTFAMTALVIWITPVSANNVMFGFMRPKSLVFMPIIPVFAWLLNHIAWLISSRTLESEQLQRENELLKLEEKRHVELLALIDDARATRHDFRHHMAVVGELAQSGKTAEAAAYAEQFVETSQEGRTNLYCENGAVDAIAAHYDKIAKSRGVTVTWVLDLPLELPVKEVDFCSVLGNLVENAIIAASECDEGKRTVDVKTRAFSGNVISLIVENGFAGTVVIAENGLPQTEREGHGIGLASVAAVVRKYDGSFDVSAGGSSFSATVLLYARE